MDYDRPHRRLNPLTGQWILVSPHRSRRPWQGQVEKLPAEILPSYDPSCYLCPGNARSGGQKNPDYQGTYVFDNDFSALLPPERAARPAPVERDRLLVAESEDGICRVVCFSPRHDLTLPLMTPSEVEAVIRTWSEQTEELGHRDFINYVQVFENKGVLMGCSNPHPHSQIWATRHIPNEPTLELTRQLDYRGRQGSCLLCDYLEREKMLDERIVAANECFTALVPFWANWPFEVMVISHRHTGSLPNLRREEVGGLADILRRVTIRYDNLFEISFPYSMGFHQSPCDGGEHPEWHLHAHFYPPLLRSAKVRKFMVGFEMLAQPQRDLTPESAAQRLRDLSDKHYRA